MTDDQHLSGRSAVRAAEHSTIASFDVRPALALLFGVLGVLLAGYGYATRGDTELYVKSGYVNVNVRWGMVLLGFAALMTLLSLGAGMARRRRAVDSAGRASSSDSDPPRDE